eukprot:m.119716 g.119716  ORF g.119716 m.119716 type:complete len:193 (-) comp9562_c1_seq3:1178-1756(-)
MEKLKKFIEQKQTDRKFKKAGDGHALGTREELEAQQQARAEALATSQAPQGRRSGDAAMSGARPGLRPCSPECRSGSRDGFHQSHLDLPVVSCRGTCNGSKACNGTRGPSTLPAQIGRCCRARSDARGDGRRSRGRAACSCCSCFAPPGGDRRPAALALPLFRLWRARPQAPNHRSLQSLSGRGAKGMESGC